MRVISTSGGAFPVWTANPTMRCGSYAAARETFNRRRGSHLPNWTANARPLAKSKSAYASAPRNFGIKGLGCHRARVPQPVAEWKASGRHPEKSTTRCGTGQGRPGHLLRRPERRQRRTGRLIPIQRRRQGATPRGSGEDRHVTARRCPHCYADHHREVGRDRQGAPRTDDRTREPAARRREEGPRRRGFRAHGGSGKPRPGPSNSVRAQSSSSSKRRRPKPRDAPRTPPRPRQRRAVASVGRCRGEGSQKR